ncbi:MAG: Hsp20/alpha crystallin family protein [Flexistipes sinusarabici]|uniref:Hsp20/alpha crystallin family protein n=1 Tax=Flexistipes sinusarabici TaxID=2352 RepID=A0A5D0MNW2_FLESI|nr:Hsp20/alpha crystallin family protein [Flexistipes sinusarabici]TYB33665.1 MAG: Hsp20/alpha crystallin family protein [Flexistipes sinusarabici]
MEDFDPANKIVLVHGIISDKIGKLIDYSGKMKQSVSETSIPLMDIIDSGENIEIFAELPGVKLDDFNVLLYEEYLIIEGNKAAAKSECKVTFFRMERTFTPFRRIVRLPHEVDESDVSATLKDGVLTIKIKRK